MAASEFVLCLSNHRWDSGDHRARRLMELCARERPVAYFEPPIYDAVVPELELRRDGGVLVAAAHLTPNTPRVRAEAAMRRMLDRLLGELRGRPVVWYESPDAVGFADHLDPAAIVYDCAAELSEARGASAELLARERWLVAQADLLFTSSHSLGRHKRRTTGHRSVHALPSSVDPLQLGCARAREDLVEAAEQAELPGRRVGFHGVIDERVDLGLLAALAEARPDLHFVLLGPVVHRDVTALRAANVHWFGAKSRAQLPAYLCGWDVAMLPYARCEATRFYGSSKPLEYLAAGKPVVATALPDLVDPLGRAGLAWIADGPGEFGEAIDEALASDRLARLAHADAYLEDHSWARTWAAMWARIERAIVSRRPAPRVFAAPRVPSGASLSAAGVEVT